jgi:hypothetical protein
MDPLIGKDSLAFTQPFEHHKTKVTLKGLEEEKNHKIQITVKDKLSVQIKQEKKLKSVLFL